MFILSFVAKQINLRSYSVSINLFVGRMIMMFSTLILYRILYLFFILFFFSSLLLHKQTREQ